MAFYRTQGVLSLDLTRLGPQLALIGGEVVKKIAKEISGSGSNIVVEDDLVQVFGRNKLDPAFKSSFTTMVQEHSITPLKGLLDITLESGAGPTVKRSLGSDAYLSSVAQLSLLAFVHDSALLTTILRQSLEQRAESTTIDFIPPDYQGLVGTLQAIKEQTTAYRWEFILEAIENKLVLDQTDTTHLARRALPPIILQGLLDDMTAIQRFPDQRMIAISTHSGTATIVAWAHKLLGLTVRVHRMEDRDQSIAFGDGEPCIVITDTSKLVNGPQEDVIALLSDNGGVDFELRSPVEDIGLTTTSCPHAVQDYGTAILKASGVRSSRLQTELSQYVLAICLAVMRRHIIKLEAQRELPKSGECLDSIQRLPAVARMLFSSNNLSIEKATTIARDENIFVAEWTTSDLPQTLVAALNSANVEMQRNYWHSYQLDLRYYGIEPRQDVPPYTVAPSRHLGAIVYSLCRTMLALSNITNIEDCAALPLSLRSCHEAYTGITQVVPCSGSEAWLTLTRLICGDNPSYKSWMDRTCVISHNGWSLLLDAVNGGAPGDVSPYLYAVKGVPTRKGERRRFVLDFTDRVVLAGEHHESGLYEAKYRSLEQSLLAHQRRARPAPSRCATEDHYILITHRYTMGENPNLGHVDVGPRCMQELCWSSIQLDTCSQPVDIYRPVQLPQGCVAFNGWSTIEAYESRTDSSSKAWRSNAVAHVAMTAGNRYLQWVVLCCSRYWTWSDWEGAGQEAVTYLRSTQCCMQSAVEVVSRDRPGFPKLLIV